MPVTYQARTTTVNAALFVSCGMHNHGTPILPANPLALIHRAAIR